MNTQKMHSYVWGWASLLMAFIVTLPIAMLRVSSTERFSQQPFTSESCAGQNTMTRAVTSFWMCAQLKVEPLESKK
jgi:hypothetical protein